MESCHQRPRSISISDAMKRQHAVQSWPPEGARVSGPLGAAALLLALLMVAPGAEAQSVQYVDQGPKLVGTGAVGPAQQGFSVALSADGNTAVVGGNGDNRIVGPITGAAWVWTRSGEVWSQQGPKLVGSDAVGVSLQGISVAVS